MQERTWQLLSANGQQCKANTFNTYVNIGISQRLASGHWSNDGGGNAIMLTGRWRNKSRRQKAQEELE
jgi:hypothetical protein